MSNWQSTNLGSVLQVKYGKDHKSLSVGTYPCIGSGGVMRFVSTSLYEEESILIPRKGSLNNIMYMDKPFWTVDTMFWTKIDKSVANPKFLFYQLTQIDYENLNVGSAVPSLTVPVINDIAVTLPSLKEQQAIAEVLSSLDDKIDLLNRQNQTLEQMAETLFRKWFVEEAKEEWEISTIGQELVTILGGTPSTKNPEYWDGNIPWINSGEINKFRILEGTKFITELGLNRSNTKLLPKGSTVLAITGATLGQISLLEIETCANQSVVAILPTDLFPRWFVFLWIKYKLPDIVLNETGGAQGHINKNDINSTLIVKPNPHEITLAGGVISPLFDKISNNMGQIKTLEQQRDTLLPKLMSAEVRVKVKV